MTRIEKIYFKNSSKYFAIIICEKGQILIYIEPTFFTVHSEASKYIYN